MENKTNKCIAVTYRLYTDGDNGRELVEEATAEQPFQFISGFGFALDAFEEQLINTEKGQNFAFSLTKEQAYGKYDQERVLDLERSVFTINGHFDHEHIYQDAIVPLQNEEGQRFYGHVLEVGEEKVKIDLNHPLAGEDLHFEGTVIENREATKEEINGMIAHLTGGCSCGCHHDHDCEGGCHHHDHDCDGDCECGHCHE